MKQPRLLITGLAIAAIAAVGCSQKPADSPAKGQGAQVQTKDDSAAASQPAPTTAGPAVGGGERLKGAAVGAAIGGVAGNAGAGAAVGVVVGGAKARQNQEAQNQESAAQK
jgi:hypothetical protein